MTKGDKRKNSLLLLIDKDSIVPIFIFFTTTCLILIILILTIWHNEMTVSSLVVSLLGCLTVIIMSIILITDKLKQKKENTNRGETRTMTIAKNRSNRGIDWGTTVFVSFCPNILTGPLFIIGKGIFNIDWTLYPFLTTIGIFAITLFVAYIHYITTN